VILSSVFRFIFSPETSFSAISVARKLLILVFTSITFWIFRRSFICWSVLPVWALTVQFFASFLVRKPHFPLFRLPESFWFVSLGVPVSGLATFAGWTSLPFSYSHVRLFWLALLLFLSFRSYLAAKVNFRLAKFSLDRMIYFILSIAGFIAECKGWSPVFAYVSTHGLSFLLSFSDCSVQELLLIQPGSLLQLRGTEFVKSFCFTPFSGKRFRLIRHCCFFFLVLLRRARLPVLCVSKLYILTYVWLFFFCQLFPPVSGFRSALFRPKLLLCFAILFWLLITEGPSAAHSLSFPRIWKLPWEIMSLTKGLYFPDRIALIFPLKRLPRGAWLLQFIRCVLLTVTFFLSASCFRFVPFLADTRWSYLQSFKERCYRSNFCSGFRRLTNHFPKILVAVETCFEKSN
jgi:hypothetical protein